MGSGTSASRTDDPFPLEDWKALLAMPRGFHANPRLPSTRLRHSDPTRAAPAQACAMVERERSKAKEKPRTLSTWCEVPNTTLDTW